MAELTMLRFIIIVITLCLPTSYTHAQTLDEDNSKAVILAYHRIGEPEHIDSNLSIEQFTAHIDEILHDDYTILPLPEIISALKTKTPLPPKTIAITFEGGYRSAYNNAIPILIKNDLPFTLFFSSGSTKIKNHLDWKTLKKISKYKHAALGILPESYTHIAHSPKPEATRSINKARIAFKENLGYEATLFAYPFGETSNEIKEILRAQGFTAALSLQSGPAHSSSDILALPRFTMTRQYGDLDRFRMITNTSPLPIIDIQPEDSLLTAPLTQIGFTIPAALTNQISSLSCHISGQSKPTIETLGNRVEIIPSEPITGERTRLNCTLPIQTDNDEKSWRWFGMLLH